MVAPHGCSISPLSSIFAYKAGLPEMPPRNFGDGSLRRLPRRFLTVGDLKLDLREPRREVTRRIKELQLAKRVVVSDPEILGGVPVFRRTRIPVHYIADLLRRGDTLKALRESYPTLSDEMIRLAPIYAA
jgi:uncharacterized protein (DUF433 family)